MEGHIGFMLVATSLVMLMTPQTQWEPRYLLMVFSRLFPLLQRWGRRRDREPGPGISEKHDYCPDV